MALTKVKTDVIAADSITSDKIGDDAVVAAAIADDAVGAAAIADDAIVAAAIADDAIVAAAIADDAVVAAAIADNAVDIARLNVSDGSSGQVLSTNGSGTLAFISSGTTNMSLNEYSGNGVATAFTLAVEPGTKNNTQAFIDGVYQEKATYSTSGTTITFTTAPASGTSVEVMCFTATSIGAPSDDTVSTAKLVDDAVTAAKIADDAVVTAAIADDAITAALIADDAVVTAAIADDAITAALIADDAVVTAAIADDAITAALIADDAVVAAAIADNAVDIARLNVSDGSANQVLTTNGSGTLSFATVGGAYSDWSIISGATNLAAKGQYVSNNGSAVIHTLPAGSAEDTIVIANAGAGTVTLARTSSQNINSAGEDATLPQGNSAQLVYVDGTIGWFEV